MNYRLARCTLWSRTGFQAARDKAVRIKMRQLEAFRAVVSTGSITGAARALGLSQPTVSNLVIALEEELKVQLFQRIKKRLVPTNEGRNFFTEVDRTLSSIEKLSNAADRLQAKATGWLNVVMPQSFVVNIVPAAIKRLQRKQPGLGVTLEYLPAGEAVESVAAGDWDFGIARLPITHRGVDMFPILQSEYVCVLPQGHLLTRKKTLVPHDLEGEAVILLSRRHEERYEIVEAFRSEGVVLNGLIETGALTATCAFVSAGIGIAILDAVIASGYPDTNIEMRPFGPSMTNEFALIRERGAIFSPEANLFIDAIREAIAESLLSGEKHFRLIHDQQSD